MKTWFKTEVFPEIFHYPHFTHAALRLSTILKSNKVVIFTGLTRFIFVSRPDVSFVKGVLNASVKYIDRVLSSLDSSL
jgi:hypothetical protein